MRNSGPIPAPAPKSWTRPALIRLGRIEDVAASQTAGPQGGGMKS